MRNRSVTYSAEAVFEAIADPTRRALLDLLRRGSQQAGEIAGAFSVSRPAISRHLRRLRRAQLVASTARGATGFINSILNRSARWTPGSIDIAPSGA